MNFKAVLFDFDYTLADSSKGIVTCFRHILVRHGYTGVDDAAIKRTIGNTLENSFSILTGVTDAEQLAVWRKEYEQDANIHMTVNTVLYPDAATVLRRLKEQGIRLGIISTKYRYRIMESVDRYLSPDLFDVIVGGEDVVRHKPDAEGLLKALEKLNIHPSQALYVGDSVIDAGAARNAGTAFAGVTTGTTTQAELAAFPHLTIINELSELLTIED